MYYSTFRLTNFFLIFICTFLYKFEPDVIFIGTGFYKFILIKNIWIFNGATSWENRFMTYANKKGTDQTAHSRSLICTFVVHCLDRIIPLVSISKFSSLYLASVAAQAGLCLTWLQTPNTGFLVTRLSVCSVCIENSIPRVIIGLIIPNSYPE